MPADSELPPPVAPPAPRLPVTWRPLGPRIAGIVAGVALLVVCAFAWIGFDSETRAKFTVFQDLTLLFFAIIIAVLLVALTRSRAVAARDGLVVVNGFRRRHFEWAQIVSVNLPAGAPWVTLDLNDGSTVSVMGIQSSDGDRAKRAVRQLRVFVAELPR